MSQRLSVIAQRASVVVLVALGATATLTYAAGSNVDSASPTATPAPTVGTVVVPDVKNQAFVFAKGTLEDAGLSWRVSGSVHGYASNTVVSQSPAAGTKLLDTGAPLVTVRLKRNPKYGELGEAEDTSPYVATVVQPVGHASQPLGPAAVAGAAPVKVPLAPKQHEQKPKVQPAPTAAPKPAAAKAAAQQARPPAFAVPGGKKEPLDEMPLPSRAKTLGVWLDSHAHPTGANVEYWLYQHEWIVAGAKLGWWHGADALRTLVAVDQRVQSQWGIGAKSAAEAAAALDYVEARTRQ